MNEPGSQKKKERPQGKLEKMRKRKVRRVPRDKHNTNRTKQKTQQEGGRKIENN